jgi:eukaryotic-like serine/threonine-protein kinase
MGGVAMIDIGLIFSPRLVGPLLELQENPNATIGQVCAGDTQLEEALRIRLRVSALLDVWEKCPEKTPEELCRGKSELIPAVQYGIRILGSTVFASTGQPPPRPMGTARYRFLDYVDRGGMGEIWRGWDNTFRREVAIKVATSHVGVSRFKFESLILARLQHPGIVPAHDYGKLPSPDNRPFLVMKYVRGQTLENLLQPGQSHALVPRAQLLSIFEQVCNAVASAHDKGIIHRDLKPKNVMVGEFGEVQVLDWGLAKCLTDAGHCTPAEIDDVLSFNLAHELYAREILREQAQSTSTVEEGLHRPSAMITCEGRALGTPRYMPPEQARGDLGAMDRRSDVFGLGAILCQILTGSPPYDDADLAVAKRRAKSGELDEVHRRLRQSDQGHGLADIAIRCLQQSPASRFSDAREVARAVQDFQGAIEARLQEERARAHAFKAKLVALTLAFALTLAAVLLAWRIYGRHHSFLSEVRAQVFVAANHRNHHLWKEAAADIKFASRVV